MAIQATTTCVVPATNEKVYPLIWISRTRIISEDCNGDTNANVCLRKYRVLEDGTNEFGPEQIEFQIEGVYANSEFDPTQMETLGTMLATATSAQKLGMLSALLISTVEGVAKERNLI